MGLRDIPLCEPCLSGREWEYVRECLDSGWVSSVGQYVSRLEQDVAAYLGARYAVATSSGTAALHTALRVAGVAPNDEVLVSSLTFIAPANAVRYLGAWPTFIDSESRYWQMDVDKLSGFLSRGCRWTGGALWNKRTGRRVTAILPVHILGHPVDMDPLMELAEKFQLAVIEDATESLGGSYRGRRVGRLAHIACLSFNGNKIVTCGGGGMIVTDNQAWARRSKYLTTQAKDDGVEYVHQEVGYNYRLTNVQAAVGVAQLERLDEHVVAKRRIAERYRAALNDVPGLTLMTQASWARSVFWMYTVLVNPRLFGMTSRSLLRVLRRSGIQTRPLWQPMHRSPAHRGADAVDCSIADRLYLHGLSLPCSVNLQPDAQDCVIASIRRTSCSRTSARSISAVTAPSPQP
jgi:perosamine synthetase